MHTGHIQIVIFLEQEMNPHAEALLRTCLADKHGIGAYVNFTQKNVHIKHLPGTVNINQEVLSITGHNSMEEWIAFDKGYESHERVMMDWIENWDGSVNSALGSLLNRKFNDLCQKKQSGA